MTSHDLKTLSKKTSYLPYTDQYTMVKPGQGKSMNTPEQKEKWDGSLVNTAILKSPCAELSPSLGFSSVQSLSRVWLFATPWVAARQASLSITNSQSSLRLTSIESVMSSSHLILGHKRSTKFFYIDWDSFCNWINQNTTQNNTSKEMCGEQTVEEWVPIHTGQGT